MTGETIPQSSPDSVRGRKSPHNIILHYLDIMSQ